MTSNGLTSISRDTPAALRIASGESVELRAEDWCYGKLTADPATYGAMQRPRCPVAGPVDIAGAEVGDSVAIDVERITLDTRGTAARLRGVGPLAPASEETRVWDVTRNDQWVELAALRFAFAPMIGVIGVRPDSDQPIGTRYTGVYGGNLDTRQITTGTRVELPVLTPGAGVFLGDLHAAMGDGELTATGCEFAGSVRIRIDLLKNLILPGPRLRFGNCWATLATSKDFNEASRQASRAMHEWIKTERGMDDDAAAFVIGMAGGLGVSQVVNPSGVTVKVIVDWNRVSTESR